MWRSTSWAECDRFDRGEEVNVVSVVRNARSGLDQLLSSSGGEHFCLAPTCAPESAPKVTLRRPLVRYRRSEHMPGDEEEPSLTRMSTPASTGTDGRLGRLLAVQATASARASLGPHRPPHAPAHRPQLAVGRRPGRRLRRLAPTDRLTNPTSHRLQRMQEQAGPGPATHDWPRFSTRHKQPNRDQPKPITGPTTEQG